MRTLGVALLGLFWALLIGVAVYFDRRGKPTSVVLLPYQRGVLFRRGMPVRDVGPGKHCVWSGTELLVHGDVRPVSVNYENQVVALQDGFAALYGFLASAEVRDIRKALYSARNYSQVPVSVLLSCVRRNLNANTKSSLALEKETIVRRIEEEAKSRLNQAGFELLSFRLTQLVIGTMQPESQKTPSLNSADR